MSNNYRQIDLNCDLAQAWGPYKHKNEEALLPFVSTVNIACGGHSGDPPNILKALILAKQNKLAVGAHIGYPDLNNFGRRELKLDQDELLAYISSQLGLLAAISKSQNIEITHFRPHGALYYKCASDTVFAEQLAKIVSSFSRWLTFIGPAGNYLNAISDGSGLKVAGEIHLDKFYRRDGTLSKASLDENVNFDFALNQAHSAIWQGKLLVEGGRYIRLPFKTIHLNMNKTYSLDLAKEVFNLLNQSPESLESRNINFQISDLMKSFKTDKSRSLAFYE